MIPIPSTWTVAGLLVATLAAGLGVQTVRLAHAQTALAREQAGRAADHEASAIAARAAEASARAEEARRTAAQQEIVHAAQEQATRARADAAAAAAAGGRLRLAAAAAAARCGGTAADPASSPGSTPAADPGLVLADVLGRMEARGRDLAELADARGRAGAACEHAGDSLTAGAPPAVPAP